MSKVKWWNDMRNISRRCFLLKTLYFIFEVLYVMTVVYLTKKLPLQWKIHFIALIIIRVYSWYIECLYEVIFSCYSISLYKYANNKGLLFVFLVSLFFVSKNKGHTKSSRVILRQINETPRYFKGNLF
jgi:hypothetical protein